MQIAVEEIKRLILDALPGAVFEIEVDSESGATWVTVLADFGDNRWDDVVDIYINRLLDVQDEWALWLHFMPISSRSQEMHSIAA